jgi:hypothetical protein
VLVFVILHTAEVGANDLPYGYPELSARFQPLGIPAAWTAWLAPLLIAANLAALGRAAFGLRGASRRVLLPPALLALSQILWFSLPYGLEASGVAVANEALRWDMRTHYFLWIAAAHSTQYLWVTAYYARQSGVAGSAALRQVPAGARPDDPVCCSAPMRVGRWPSTPGSACWSRRR